MELEPSLELLSAPLDNPCPTGATGMLVRVARLAQSGITSALFRTTGILELGRPESPSTIGTSEQLKTLCLSERPDSTLTELAIAHSYQAD